MVVGTAAEGELGLSLLSDERNLRPSLAICWSGVQIRLCGARWLVRTIAQLIPGRK